MFGITTGAGVVRDQRQHPCLQRDRHTLEYFWQTVPAGHTNGSGCKRLTGFMPAVYLPSSWPSNCRLTKWQSLMAAPKPDQNDLLGASISVDSIHLQKSGVETRSNVRREGENAAAIGLQWRCPLQHPSSNPAVMCWGCWGGLELRVIPGSGMHWFKNNCLHGGMGCLHPLLPLMLKNVEFCL